MNILKLKEAKNQGLEYYGTKNYYNYIKDEISYNIINGIYDSQIKIIGYIIVCGKNHNFYHIEGITAVNIDKTEVITSSGNCYVKYDKGWYVYDKQTAIKETIKVNNEVLNEWNKRFLNY